MSVCSKNPLENFDTYLYYQKGNKPVDFLSTEVMSKGL